MPSNMDLKTRKNCFELIHIAVYVHIYAYIHILHIHKTRYTYRYTNSEMRSKR